MPRPIFDPDSPSDNPDRFWPNGDRPDFAQGEGAEVNIEVTGIEVNGEFVDTKKLYKALAPIMKARADKIVQRAHEYLYGQGGQRNTKPNPTDHRSNVSLKDGIKVRDARFDSLNESVEIPITVISRHAAPVEFGSGLYNTQRFRTRSTQFAETRGGTQRIVQGGKFYVTPRKVQGFIIVPMKGAFRATAKTQKGREREEARRTRTIGGVKYIIVAYALQGGQHNKGYLRKAVHDHRLALLQELRIAIAKSIKEDLDNNAVGVELSVSVS